MLVRDRRRVPEGIIVEGAVSLRSAIGLRQWLVLMLVVPGHCMEEPVAGVDIKRPNSKFRAT
jgi:hypothetical protein